jgi:hypothetical protein
MVELPAEFERPPERSRFAVYSVAFAILNLTCALPVIGAMIAIYCGFMAKRAIRESGGKLEGTALANWGIVLGFGGLIWALLGVLIVVCLILPVQPDLEKIHGIVAEFREAYNKSDAATLHAKMSPQARQKTTVEELREKIEAYHKQMGPTIDGHSFKWWTFFWNSSEGGDLKERITRFPYDLTGPNGNFLGYFFCRKLSDGTWRLEGFALFNPDAAP